MGYPAYKISLNFKNFIVKSPLLFKLHITHLYSHKMSRDIFFGLLKLVFLSQKNETLK